MGKIHAGEVSERTINEEECIQVATGSPLPGGADAVVMVEDTEKEDTREEENLLKIFKPVYPGGNVSDAGRDIKIGEIVLKRDEILNPARIGVLAALGIGNVKVYEKPMVSIIATGNEIVDVGAGRKLREGEIYDVNTYTLSAIVKENGGIPIALGSVEDDREKIEGVIENAMNYDLIILSGGSSVGERDVLYDVIADAGRVLFHGVQIKPGKPTLCGIIDEKLVLGMPGYPTSCMVNAHIFLIPVIRKMSHMQEKIQKRITAKLSRRLVSSLGRHQFLTVKVENGIATPVFKESGAITSMSKANGYIEIPATTDFIEKGDEVEMKLF